MGGGGTGLISGGSGGYLHLDFPSEASSNPLSNSSTGALFNIGGGQSVLSGLNLGSSGVILLALIGLVGVFTMLKG